MFTVALGVSHPLVRIRCRHPGPPKNDSRKLDPKVGARKEQGDFADFSTLVLALLIRGFRLFNKGVLKTRRLI
jgi:hypothetical protein